MVYTHSIMWLFFALLSGALFAVHGLMARYLLKGDKDAWAFSFFFSLVGGVVSLPFMLADPQLPQTVGPWLLAALVGLVIVAHNLLFFKGSNTVEASLSGAITKVRLVWIFLFSILFLGASFSWQVLLGTVLTIAASLVIMHRFKRPESLRGILFVLAASVLNAAVIILLKELTTSFNAVSLTFFAAFLPAILLNFILMPRAVQRIRRAYTIDGRKIVIACAVGALANLAMNQALVLGDASGVVVITEAFLVVVLVGEHIVLKEKDQLWAKAAAVLLATAGAVLIQTAA